MSSGDKSAERQHRTTVLCNGDIPGLQAEYAINTVGYADVYLTWDATIIPLSPEEARNRLKDSEPRLAYDGNTVRTRCLRDGEEVLVAERLREFFEAEAARG